LDTSLFVETHESFVSVTWTDHVNKNIKQR